MMGRFVISCVLLPLLCAAAASAALDKTALMTVLTERGRVARLENDISACKRAGNDAETRSRLSGLNKQLHAVKREEEAAHRIVAGCWEKVQRSGNINAQDKQGRTLLMAVAATGVNEAVAMVMQEKPDLSLTDGEGHTALWYEQQGAGNLIHGELLREWQEALQEGDAARVGTVLAGGLSPITPTENGNPALGEALDRGLSAIVTELLAHDAVCTYPMADGRSLLQVAVEKDDAAVMTTLLAAGVSADEPLSTGESPLRYLLRRGKPESVVAFLKGAGLDNHAEADTCVCCLAARYAPPETLKLLLNTLSKPHAEDAYGNTPLLEAARRGDVAVYDAVVAAGGFSWTNSRGETALMHAALSGQEAMVKRVLETMPAEFRNQADKAGRRAADYAALLPNPQPLPELPAE